MIQEVQLEKENIVLDSDKLYSGGANPQEDEKLVRKAVGLPIKKQLIYYTDSRNANSAIEVKTYQLVEMYNITDRWYTVEITLIDGSKTRIHSNYLAEMQKPSFVADMIAQLA